MVDMTNDPRFPISHPGGRCQATIFHAEAGIWDRCDRSAEPGNVHCDDCLSAIDAEEAAWSGEPNGNWPSVR